MADIDEFEEIALDEGPLLAGGHIHDAIEESRKKSQRWQLWSAPSPSSDEEDNAEPSWEDRESFRTSTSKGLLATPLFQTPSNLFFQYEQAVDTAMQHVRQLKAAVRDEDWEDHNADEIVASLFALSRSCVQTAELFVTRQKLEVQAKSDQTSDSEDPDEENESEDSSLHGESIYSEQFPVLQSVIDDFVEAKRVHDELSKSVRQEQRELKQNIGVYMTPSLNSRFQKIDTDAMSVLDPFYTDYSSIEEFLFNVMRTPSHPFTKSLDDFVDYFNKTYLCSDETPKISTLAVTVREFVDALVEGLVRRYQYLDLQRWMDQVTRSVHTQVMNLLYPSILPLYLSHFQETDDLIDEKIESLGQFKADPSRLGVQQRLCSVINDHVKQHSANDEEENEFAEYSNTLDYLKQLPLQKNIDDKLHHLVQSINLLCNSVETFYLDQIKTSVTLSADDVLSLFVYAIICSGVPCIYSQCRMMDHFILDETSLGEEGYALATLDTALSAILAIDLQKVISSTG